MVALLAEGVDRNLMASTVASTLSVSPSSRRAWIEILSYKPDVQPAYVALLAEGVDRNLMMLRSKRRLRVALLAEGVDRNLMQDERGVEIPASPSSRRAWIEMS